MTTLKKMSLTLEKIKSGKINENCGCAAYDPDEDEMTDDDTTEEPVASLPENQDMNATDMVDDDDIEIIGDDQYYEGDYTDDGEDEEETETDAGTTVTSTDLTDDENAANDPDNLEEEWPGEWPDDWNHQD